MFAESVHLEQRLLLFVCCLMSQQHASVSQGQIGSDNRMSYHTEKEVVHQTCFLTQSQHTNTGPACPSSDPLSPGAWQGIDQSNNNNNNNERISRAPFHVPE